MFLSLLYLEIKTHKYIKEITVKFNYYVRQILYQFLNCLLKTMSLSFKHLTLSQYHSPAFNIHYHQVILSLFHKSEHSLNRK